MRSVTRYVTAAVLAVVAAGTVAPAVAGAAELGNATSVLQNTPLSQVTPQAAKAQPQGPGILQEGTQLKPGTVVKSNNGKYQLVMQNDGNLVMYDSASKPLWASNTARHPGAFAVVQNDGNVVVYAKLQKGHKLNPLWATNTNFSGGGYLAVQDDGNLVLYRHDGSVAWSRWMYIGQLPANYELQPRQVVKSPNGRYQLVMQTDGNLVMYDGTTPLWASNTAGHPGAFAVMQADGNFVVYAQQQSGQKLQPLWASNTARHPGAFLNVQNDGNVVVYAKLQSGHKPVPLWASRH